jgi:hypothetical protein
MFGLNRRRVRLGPWQGRYYEIALRPVAGGVVIAWNGKRVVSYPPMDTGQGFYEFDDGSWANTVTGEFHSAPGGELITVTGEDADLACTAFHGYAQGRFVTVQG